MALEASKMGDWSWDAASDLVNLSPHAAAIFGIPPGTLLTWEQVALLIPEEDRPIAHMAAASAAAARYPRILISC